MGNYSTFTYLTCNYLNLPTITLTLTLYAIVREILPDNMCWMERCLGRFLRRPNGRNFLATFWSLITFAVTHERLQQDSETEWQVILK